MTITMTREALLERLAEQLKAAQAADAKALAKHREDEKKCLEGFRRRIREALKWDYKKAKDAGFYVSNREDRPSCPTRQAERFERLIKDIKLDMRKRQEYAVTTGNELYQAIHWQPEPVKKSLCD